MATVYWIFEYIKVFAAYMLVLYVWPLVVFHGFLKGKSRALRFAFCFTAQVVLLNTVVIALGLCHILNEWVVRLLFYGVFVACVIWRVRLGEKELKTFKRLVTGTYGRKLFFHNASRKLFEKAKRKISSTFNDTEGRWLEYLFLAVIVVFGMIYFSWGAFQDYSYGFGDLYVHNEWIYGLTQGQVFSDGVYPEAMHVMIYSIHTLFGVRIYSILLFLAGIHASVYLISVYLLLREIFRWRFTPQLVLAAFLTVDAMRINMVYGMSRLQWTLPQEYALPAQFLCAAFLIKYLRSEKQAVWRGKTTKGYWDENLLIFMLAIAASIATHYYVTIMAFLLCISIVPFALRRIFNRKRFLPLAAACLCGAFIAVLPMAGALASGIPFNASIDWAVSVINGDEWDDASAQVDETLSDDESEAEDDTVDVVSGKEAEQLSLAEKIKAYIFSLPERFSSICEDCYVDLYGTERGNAIVFMLVLSAGLWLIYRVIATLLHLIPALKRVKPGYFDTYPMVILASAVFMFMYNPTSFGLPLLIAESRLCSTVQVLNLAMIAIPIDMLISLAALFLPAILLNAVGAAAVIGIYIGTQFTGSFHGFLYYELTRYNGAVMTTYSITKTLPEGSYTIVSTVDELYQMIQYGYHEELLNFVNHGADADYTLPSEYIFIFVEKNPIQYSQYHFFTGPSWLAVEKYADYYGEEGSQCPDIISSEISEELVADVSTQFANSSSLYSDLESRTILESTMYEWCQEFDALYPNELHVYYEDDDFICYYFKQNPKNVYRLGIR